MCNHHLLLVVSLLATLVSSTTTQKCYLMDGTSAPSLSPCNPPSNTTSTTTKQHSPCCPLRPSTKNPAICLTSGLCLSSNGLIYISGCTDPTWTDPACPSVCPDARTNWTGKALENKDWKQGQVLDHWQIMTCAPKKVCCRRFSGNEGCCGNRSLWVKEFEAGMPKFRVWYGEGINGYLGGEGSELGEGGNETSMTTATGTGSQSTSAADEGKEMCREATVGAAVGAPLGASFVATLAALAWAIRKQKVTEKQLRGVEAQVQMQNPSLSSMGYYKEAGARQVQKPGNHAELSATRQYELDGRSSA